MNILQIAPLVERVPPKKYGGTERVVHALTEELVQRGHDITLMASGDSVTSAKLISVYPRSLREANVKNLYGPNPWKMLHIGTAYQMQHLFDIIHDHNELSLPTANIAKTPVVFTIHGAITPDNRRLYERLSRPYFITISRAQTLHAPNIHTLGTIHNGLPMEHYPFSKRHKGYLLFVGRISPEKGVHYAIEVANDLDLPLTIAAKLDKANPHDTQYFYEYIQPQLSDQIRWAGEVDEKERNMLMSKALCMLHPITWREPFGLTLIEGMACGCPIVAFNKGSIPEIIVDGKTGFIVDDLAEMIACVEHIEVINRAYCRSYALQHFNAKRMTDEYEAIYKRILQHTQPVQYRVH